MNVKAVLDRVCSMFVNREKKRYPRERFVLPKEWEALFPVLQSQPTKVRIYFSLLFLLGSRMSELRTARWLDLDLDAGLWHKTKTKNGRRQIVPLGPEVIALLRQLPVTGVYVFQGDRSKGGNADQPWSRTAVQHWWRRIRSAAGCRDVQIRDIRRTAATWMVQSGENLMTIKEILNHSSVSITQVYAKADTSTQAAALDRHARRVMGGVVKVPMTA
jgi:integrase